MPRATPRGQGRKAKGNGGKARKAKKKGNGRSGNRGAAKRNRQQGDVHERLVELLRPLFSGSSATPIQYPHDMKLTKANDQELKKHPGLHLGLRRISPRGKLTQSVVQNALLEIGKDPPGTWSVADSELDDWSSVLAKRIRLQAMHLERRIVSMKRRQKEAPDLEPQEWLKPFLTDTPDACSANADSEPLAVVAASGKQRRAKTMIGKQMMRPRRR